MYISKALWVAAVVIASTPVSAATVTGIAVGSNVGTTQVGILAANGAGPDGGNQLGSPAIQYYIPLASSGTVTYGVNGGTASDSGSGGQTLEMWLRFAGFGAGNATLTVRFQDLDLLGGNDPSNFVESLRLFKADGTTALTPLITSIGGLVTGDFNAQVLTLALGLVSDPLYLKLSFKSCLNPNSGSCSGSGTNTAEYLSAQVSTVPLPGALVLFGSALVGLGALTRRRKQTPCLAT